MAAKLIGAGLATIALAGAAIGIGLIFGSLIQGFALTEAMGLFALMMALIFLYAF
ncbi:hypothetical protein SmJEL517_g06232 [Synchytrium microbalum]|uniref:ATP synthase subunit 9, mitochondrial n=1 Tax=Synchytrium microbalum TaxID=1806994 RepID=A0A507BWA9_9FUNG|nr:uncharacterized protein SmJEL517_g06232 [Synchytrium microbalum]TPX30134.1 hypothetical protein SmJEL517_g06232 [Synchytrium microbalum]